jgi:hypothetical protein
MPKLPRPRADLHPSHELHQYPRQVVQERHAEQRTPKDPAAARVLKAGVAPVHPPRRPRAEL